MLKISFKKKRRVTEGKHEKNMFMSKCVHVTSGNVQKGFVYGVNTGNNYKLLSCGSRLYRHLVGLYSVRRIYFL